MVFLNEKNIFRMVEFDRWFQKQKDPGKVDLEQKR